MSDETIKDEEQLEAVEAATTDSVEETDEEVAEEAEPTLEEQLAAAEAKAKENLDGWQRARAEFANARKRFDKQRLDSRMNALVEMAGKLLPVIDDFDLAFQNVPEEIAKSDWYGGLELIPRKLNTILEGIGIERIEAIGQPFDPNMHNAIMQEESADHDSDTVIKEFQAGYKIGERVVRPSVVVVAA